MKKCPYHDGDLMWLTSCTYYCNPGKFYAHDGHEIDLKDLEEDEP